MTEMLDKITQKEYEQMDWYRKSYVEGEGTFVSTQTILSAHWAQQKERLYKMLGNQLIISKPVNILADPNYFKKKICSNMTYTQRRFLSNIRTAAQNKLLIIDAETYCFSYSKTIPESKELYLKICDIIDNYDYLATNSYDGMSFTLPAEKPIKISRGEKTLNILKKLTNYFNLDTEEYENFRIWHSQVLNEKYISGTLHLSIHPLDFMTMSDNRYNWGSCMSWENNGCYRAGTVEMMNSEVVIVAYLTGDKDTFIIKDAPWSNKKWRCLYVVNQNCLVKVKGYPYQSSGLDKEVMDWIKKLAATNLDLHYSEECYEYEDDNLLEINGINRDFKFCTENMYNDFGTLPHHEMYVNTNLSDKMTFFPINYSGPGQCMWCGNSENLEEDSLCCSDCYTQTFDYYCEHCGRGLYEDEVLTYNNSIYCEECYDNIKVKCSICKEYHHPDYISSIALVNSPADTTTSNFTNICRNCFSNEKTNDLFSDIRYKWGTIIALPKENVELDTYVDRHNRINFVSFNELENFNI